MGVESGFARKSGGCSRGIVEGLGQQRIIGSETGGGQRSKARFQRDGHQSEGASGDQTD